MQSPCCTFQDQGPISGIFVPNRMLWKTLTVILQGHGLLPFRAILQLSPCESCIALKIATVHNVILSACHTCSPCRSCVFPQKVRVHVVFLGLSLAWFERSRRTMNTQKKLHLIEAYRDLESSLYIQCLCEAPCLPWKKSCVGLSAWANISLKERHQKEQ